MIISFATSLSFPAIRFDRLEVFAQRETAPAARYAFTRDLISGGTLDLPGQSISQASQRNVAHTTSVDICNRPCLQGETQHRRQGSTMQKFVVYRRVSTEEQGKSGLGLEAQTRDIDMFLTHYAETPFEVVAEFTEVQSGKDSDRPELAKALDLCRKLGATLLVAKLDRLSRRVSQIATLMEDRRIRFRVASMPHADNFQLHIYAALAEQEREFISRRTKAALAEAKAKGKKLGGIRPKTEARNVAVKAQAEGYAQKVAGMVQPMRQAGKTLREIADTLNASGVQTSRGGKWSAAQVMRTLDRLDSAA